MFDHEQLESWVAPWVLGALEPDEADAVASHIQGCSSCLEVATRLRRVLGVLPLGADEVKPPARLRERVLAAAATSRKVAALPASRRVRRPAVPRRRIAISWRGRVPAYAAAAAVALALLLGVVGGEVVSTRTPAPTSQVARFTLAGHQDMSGARATVIDLASDGLALVDFSGLPALDTGRVYEVWLITPGGRADPAAVFVPDANGGKVVLVSRPLSGYSLMAVTNEAGPQGTQAPTQQPQLYGRVG
jgi:anti-sigma-K factor RskA